MKLRIAAIQENLVWYSDSCIEQLFGFCRFSFFMFHLLLTTHNPMDECYQGYDNHMIRTATNRIGQWVCSVICVGVCDCDESLLKLECLVLGNFLMRLSHIWEKNSRRKNKMLYYADARLVVFSKFKVHMGKESKSKLVGEVRGLKP